MAERLLKSKGVDEIDKVRIDLDPAERDAMMQKTGAARCRRFTSATPMWAVLTICRPLIVPVSSMLC
jgi:hypothetical protein